MKKILFILFFGCYNLLYSEDLPQNNINECLEVKKQAKEKWILENQYTADVDIKLNVFVPLEILSDIDINAIIIDDENLDIPFEIELNRKPEKKDQYKIKFSETDIDIDKDGKVDTHIYSSSPYVNDKIVTGNGVKIEGKKISKDGKYKKKVYITLEIE